MYVDVTKGILYNVLMLSDGWKGRQYNEDMMDLMAPVGAVNSSLEFC